MAKCSVHVVELPPLVFVVAADYLKLVGWPHLSLCVRLLCQVHWVYVLVVQVG